MNWRIAKASIVGTGHAQTATPCQDSHYVMHLGNHLVVAVSDGLGSAALSHEGSRIACSAAVDAIAEAYDAHNDMPLIAASTDASVNPHVRYEKTLTDAFGAARDAIEREAARTNRSLREYGCTLLVAVICEEAWYGMHVGDGTIVGLYADQSAKTLSVPENGEFINSTTPLTSTDYTTHMRYSHGTERLAGVALLSDGVQPMCINYKTGAAYDGFFRPLQIWLAGLPSLSGVDHALEQFLDTPKMRQKSDDDMTLVLALREP